MPIELIPGMKKTYSVVAFINRFPVLTNHATTGHKLQGQTKGNLFISHWHYGNNWPYVVLSRVREHSQLFFQEPIKRDHDFLLDARLVTMLNNMKQKEPLPYQDD
jgi:hypothetical protein